ncbi:hypothetical protein [Methylotenera sp.]|uniref:hypothetical protein n=1 Tax=Methylotenera sp. TaxID=2051956 RepID=UPI00345BE282
MNRHCFNGLCRYNSKGGLLVFYSTFNLYPVQSLLHRAHRSMPVCSNWSVNLLGT